MEDTEEYGFENIGDLVTNHMLNFNSYVKTMKKTMPNDFIMCLTTDFQEYLKKCVELKDEQKHYSIETMLKFMPQNKWLFLIYAMNDSEHDKLVYN